jgi:hypothetical protein
MKRTLAAVAIAALGLFGFAQTRPSISQLRVPVVPNARVLVLVNGRLELASVGSGVQLVQSGSAYEL